ncbi:MAG: biliverdin-producing heme oxygenase [Caulobacteraceae bacterium]|nr:biliverdin-producing heme oxygenase [Caulobacteraceae bacterium]
MTPVLDLIREETAGDHARLEGRLDIFTRLASPEGRGDLMQRFWGLYAGLEDRLAEWLEPVAGLDYAARRKLPALDRDLAALGLRPDPARRLPPPKFSGAVEAMGFQYVLEGSTLGGKAIARRVQSLGLSGIGLSFFDVYGSDTGNRWRDFRVLLERACAPDPAGAARGAKRGFGLVEAWLCDGMVRS